MGYTRDGEVRRARAASVRRVLWLTLGLNVGVAVAKLAYGAVTRSVAMSADGFHSMFDGTSNVIALLGIFLASRAADPEHPYGHTKYETFASAAIGAMLLLAAWRVGSSAVSRLLGGGPGPTVDVWSFAVMTATLTVNIGVAWYERRAGRRLRSGLLIADASHTASDILVSLGVIAGLAFVKLGFPAADPLIGLAIAAAIVYAAWRVFDQANETLSDRARLDVSEVGAVALRVPGVLGCHSIRTRGTSSDVYVDLHVQVDPVTSVVQGHAIAEAVEQAVVERIAGVADAIVHLEPMDEYQAAKTEGEIGHARE